MSIRVIFGMSISITWIRARIDCCPVDILRILGSICKPVIRMKEMGFESRTAGHG